VPWGIAASAAVGIAGSVMQSNAVGSAADKANSAQMRGLEQSRADLEPWRTAGSGALTGVQNAAGLNGQPGYDAAMAGFHASPSYQFQLDQGLRAIDHGAAAKGILNSSDTLHNEQTFGTGLADKEFTDYYNRLFNLSELGQKSAAQTASATDAAAKGSAQTDLSEGSALSSIYGNTAKGIGDSINSYENNSLYASRTNALANYGNPGARAAGIPSSSTTYNPAVNMTLPAAFA